MSLEVGPLARFRAWEAGLAATAAQLGGRDAAAQMDAERRCTFTLDDVAVTLVAGPQQLTLTAPAPGAEHLRLRFVSGHYYVLGSLGFQDLRTGHVAFDDRFIVKAKDPEFARFWLDPPAAAAALAAADFTSFAVARARVRATVAGVLFPDHLPRVVPAVAHAVAQLAGRGVRLGASWQALAGPLGATVELAPGVPAFVPGGVRLRLPMLGVEVVVSAEYAAAPLAGRARRLHTRASVRRTHPEPKPWALAHAERGLRLPRGPRHELGGIVATTPVRAELVAQLEAARVAGAQADTSQLFVWVDGVVEDAESLVALARAAALLADDPAVRPGGAYR